MGEKKIAAFQQKERLVHTHMSEGILFLETPFKEWRKEKLSEVFSNYTKRNRNKFCCYVPIDLDMNWNISRDGALYQTQPE